MRGVGDKIRQTPKLSIETSARLYLHNVTFMSTSGSMTRLGVSLSERALRKPPKGGE